MPGRRRKPAGAAAEKLVAEQRALQDKALADLREAFKALSAEALKQSAPEFLRLAEQTFGKFQETAKGDLAQRQESIKTLVEPLKQQLETYQQRLQQSETSQADTLGKVKEQLEKLAQSSLSLAAETQQFRMVLKSNQARGRWGEETLAAGRRGGRHERSLRFHASKRRPATTGRT